MKISELEEIYASNATGGESFPLIRAGHGYRMTIAQLRNFVDNGLNIGARIAEAAGSGLTNEFGKLSINVGYEKNGSNYPVELDSRGKLFVNVPSSGGSSGGGSGITSIKTNQSSSNIVTSLIASVQASGDTVNVVRCNGTVGHPVKPVYMLDGVLTECTHLLGKSVPATAELTDTKVTSVDNHYTPKTSLYEHTADSQVPARYGTTSVVTGLIISSDAKGHITGISLSSAYLPQPDVNANINADDVISELWGDDTSTKGNLLVKTDYAGDSYRISEFIGDIGSSTKPIYIKEGVPTMINYSINKSVPSSALFTDESTTYDGHYAPSESGAVTISSSASQVNGEVITGITLKRDGKGHLIGLNIAATKFPSPTKATNTALGVVKGNFSLTTSLNGYTETHVMTCKIPVNIDSSGNMYVELKLGSQLIMDSSNYLRVGSKEILQ